MSAATYYSTATVRSHFQDAVRIARLFAKALFASQERQFVAQEITDKTERSRLRTRTNLISMANQYQDMQPSLAAELRQLASLG